MKTILIAHNYSEISFAAMSFHLANYLAEKGNIVVFISHQPYFKNEKVVEFKNGKLFIISWSSQKRPTGFKDVFWFYRIYKKHKPDVVIGHFVGSNIAILLSKLLSYGKVKTFEYYHTLSAQILTDIKINSFRQKVLFLRKKCFYNFFCDTIICPSDMAKEDLKLYYGLDHGFVVLNPMIDRHLQKNIFKNDKININFLGRIDESKGILELIEAFKIYIDKFPNTKIVLNIAGNGSLLGRVIENIANYHSITFIGSLPYNKIDNYLNAGIFTIIPSKFDNLPTVGLESIMNQTPLLISNNTGLTKYLTDNYDCYKFDFTVNDIVLMFEKVEMNIENAANMGLNARMTFLENFSIEKYCETIKKLVS